MFKNSTRFAFASVGIVICGLSITATARSRSSADARCPAGYWLIQSLCLNNLTGDVVNAAPAAITGMVIEGGCEPGYWRLAEFCLSPATGDVELVDEKRPAEQRAEARG